MTLHVSTFQFLPGNLLCFLLLMYLLISLFPRKLHGFTTRDFWKRMSGKYKYTSSHMEIGIRVFRPLPCLKVTIITLKYYLNKLTCWALLLKTTPILLNLCGRIKHDINDHWRAEQCLIETNIYIIILRNKLCDSGITINSWQYKNVYTPLHWLHVLIAPGHQNTRAFSEST